MMIPDWLQFIFIIAALAFMSASTLFISADRKEKKENIQKTATMNHIEITKQ